MCLSCGCVLNGGSPTDDHGDAVNLTLGDLTAAANAQGQTLNQAAQNIVDSLVAIEATAEGVETIDDEVAVDEPVVKALATGPKRYVLGVAYPAAHVDGHGEWQSAEELENAAWDYARNSRRIGFYHADGTEGHADVVESYIYRGPDWMTTDIDGQEQVIKAGDWMLGGILDEPGFALVTSRKADGWSVDGQARRRKTARPKGR